MTMFEELYELATAATLTMVLSADEKTGCMTINVIPRPKKELDEAALSRALSLTATPAEFDAEFVATLKGYRGARQSLVQQAEATQEVLQAAKAASTKKAGDVLSKTAKSSSALATVSRTSGSQTSVRTPTNEAAEYRDHGDDGREDAQDKAVGSTSPRASEPAGSSQNYDLFG